MRFRIDVYTATGATPIGGPLTEVLGLSITEKLNEIGEASITIPAHVAASRGLQRGYRYRIYHETIGYLGEFKHIESAIDANAETIAIKAYDSLIALAERVAGFRRNYSNQSFSTVATNLYNTSLGWTVSYEGATLTDAITFSVEGENYLRAADYLRRYVRGWFRRQGDTEIRFGKFSSTTPVLTFVAAKNALGQLPSTQALITQLARTRQGGDVVNRVYPVGAGIGETKLDLRYSNRTTPYTVQNTTIATGAATAYYLEDSSSVTTYGRVERVIAWNEIRPITNSVADLENAANALYDIASAYLQKYRTENDAYTMSAVGVPSTLRVGDLVRVAYNGVAELETGNIGWLNVANNFFVTSITRNFDAGGEATSTIGIAANGEAVIGDTEVLYDILQDVQTLKLRTQPTQTYLSRSFDPAFMQNNANTSALYRMTLGSEILAINEMYIDLTIRPIPQPSAVNTNFTGSTSSGGAHTHDVKVYWTGTGPFYTVNVDSAYPRFYKSGAGTVDYNIPTESAGSHSHSFDHNHTITIGGTTGSFSYGSKPRISIFGAFGGNYVLTTGVGGNTEILQYDVFQTGTIVSFTSGGSTIYAVEGWVVARINITSSFTNTSWRNNLFTFTLQNWQPSNPCMVHAQVYGRVTIQPIAV